MTDGWAATEASAFWDRVGEEPPFPRDLSLGLPLALPLALVVLPALALRRIEDWLEQRGPPYRFLCADRRLRGCLVAHEGIGFLFVDGADTVDERRFTIAHEVAHFLADYLRRRAAALAKLGPSILDVLDGRRPPTRTEQIDAVLADCPIGVHVHLLERDGHAVAIDAVEERADHLACELLAPAEDVRSRMTSSVVDEEDIALTLRTAFGLPPRPAAAYARRLRAAWCPPPSFVEWLRP